MKYNIILIITIVIATSLFADDEYIARVYNTDTSPSTFLYYHYSEQKNLDDQEILYHYYLLPDSTDAVVEKAIIVNGKLKEYTSDFLILNEQSVLELDNGILTITYTKDGKTKTKTMDFNDTLLVGPLFVEHLVAHWDGLMAGETVKFRLPAADMLTTAGFYLKQIDDSKFQKPGTVVIKMGVSSIFLKLLIKPSYFVMNTETRKVEEIHGLSILPHKKDGDWKKTTNVEIYFDRQ